MCLKFHENDTLVQTGVIQGHSLAHTVSIALNLLYDKEEETTHVLYCGYLWVCRVLI